MSQASFLALFKAFVPLMDSFPGTRVLESLVETGSGIFWCPALELLAPCCGNLRLRVVVHWSNVCEYTSGE